MAQQVILNITIFENENGRYDVAYSYDAMPAHTTYTGFASIEAARASVPYTVAWREPDEECSRDVVAYAQASAK